MRDCLSCTAQNRECVFGDDWESCLTCKENATGHCDGLLDLSQIVQANIDIRKVENELTKLNARVKQDAQLLTSLSGDIKLKQEFLTTSTSFEADDTALNRVRRELQQLISTGKPVFERHKEDKLAYDELVQRLRKLRDHEGESFLELLSQVHHRTVNDCFECQTAGKACVFSDESEQCTECQHPPRKRCQGSVDDDDTDRIKTALENVDSQIHEALSLRLPDPTTYLSLKERLKHEEDATIPYREMSGLSIQELEEHSRLSSQMQKTRKELENLRNQSLIGDSLYQELRIRKRILDESHWELLRRGLFYFDELNELAGYPERRGHKSAEHMNHDEFREAVEWAVEHPGEWQESPPPLETQIDHGMDLGNASDSGIEI